MPETPVVEPKPPETPVSTATTPSTDERFAKYEQHYGDVAQNVKSVVDEVKELKARLDAQKPPAEPELPEPAPEEWVEQVREGKFKDATDSIAKAVLDRISGDVRSSATHDALEAIRVQADMERYTAKVRQDSPEVTVMEDYIGARVRERLAASRDEGKVSNQTEAIAEFKRILDEEVADAKKVYQQIRLAGKEEPKPNTTVPSNPITTPPVKPSPQSPQSVDDYLASRRKISNRMIGIPSD